MKHFIPLIFLISITVVHGQEETFNVTKGRKISIVCPSTTLMGNTFYYFRVFGVSTDELMPSKFSGGAVWLNDTAICVHTSDKASSSKKYPLEIFLRKNNVSIFKREFTILPGIEKYAVPPRARASTVSVIGFGTPLTGIDSISEKKLSTVQPLFAVDWSNTEREYKLVSFKMELSCDGKSETLSSSSSYFTAEMKNKLTGAKAGCIITLKEVKYTCTNASPDDIFTGPFKIIVRK